MSAVLTGLRMNDWTRQPHPTLKRGANNHCAYGAVASAHRNVERKTRGAKRSEDFRIRLHDIFDIGIRRPEGRS